MEDDGAYVVDLTVPHAVLLSDDASCPTTLGSMWYRATSSSFDMDDAGRVVSWSPQDGLGAMAYPAKPNTNGSRLSPDGGLVFEQEVNSGLVAEAALSETQHFTCAVRFDGSSGDARSLITVNPADRDNYLFLSEKDGELMWADQKGTVDVAIQSPRGPVWVAVGYDQGKLSIMVAPEGQSFAVPTFSAVRSATLNDDLSGSSDLFIGCRSHRKGIKKTLGTSRILDVLLWADAYCLTHSAKVPLSLACRAAERTGVPQ